MPLTVNALLIRELLFEDFVEERILQFLVVLDKFLPLFEKLFDSITLLIHMRRDFNCFAQFFLKLLCFQFALFSRKIEPTKLQSDLSPCIHQFVEVILLPLCGHLHLGNLVMQPFLFESALI